jgi:hypothetical protein
LGGKPDFNPKGLETRAASEYGSADNLVEMIKENLTAGRIAINHDRELIGTFSATTRSLASAGNRTERTMSTRTILIVVILLLLLGALPTWPYSGGWGYYPSGGLGLVLLIVVIVALLGRR